MERRTLIYRLAAFLASPWLPGPGGLRAPWEEGPPRLTLPENSVKRRG